MLLQEHKAGGLFRVEQKSFWRGYVRREDKDTSQGKKVICQSN
jgi:hypothetical protein